MKMESMQSGDGSKRLPRYAYLKRELTYGKGRTVVIEIDDRSLLKSYEKLYRNQGGDNDFIETEE